MVLCFFCSSHLIGPKLYFTLPSLFSGAFSDLRLKNGKNSAPLQKPLPPKGWSAPKQRLGGKQKPRFSQSGGSSQKSMNLQWPKNLSKSNRGWRRRWKMEGRPPKRSTPLNKAAMHQSVPTVCPSQNRLWSSTAPQGTESNLNSPFPRKTPLPKVWLPVVTKVRIRWIAEKITVITTWKPGILFKSIPDMSALLFFSHLTCYRIWVHFYFPFQCACISPFLGSNFERKTGDSNHCNKAGRDRALLPKDDRNRKRKNIPHNKMKRVERHPSPCPNNENLPFRGENIPHNKLKRVERNPSPSPNKNIPLKWRGSRETRLPTPIRKTHWDLQQRE